MGLLLLRKSETPALRADLVMRELTLRTHEVSAETISQTAMFRGVERKLGTLIESPKGDTALRVCD